MLDEELVEKLEAWIEANPEAADTSYLNVSTGEELTLRGILSKLRASLEGVTQLSESDRTELMRIEEWLGGL